MEAFEPDGCDTGGTVFRDAFGCAFKAASAEKEAAASEFAIDFAIYGEEGGGKWGVGQMAGEERGVAAGGREFGDGVGEGRAEAGQLDHARKFGAVHAAGGIFDDQVERGLRHLRHVGGPGFDEAGKGLHQAAAEDEAFAGELILQVLFEGRGRDQQADGGVAGAEGVAEFVQHGGHCV